jgi:hypothetical protein
MSSFTSEARVQLLGGSVSVKVGPAIEISDSGTSPDAQGVNPSVDTSVSQSATDSVNAASDAAKAAANAAEPYFFGLGFLGLIVAGTLVFIAVKAKG